MNLICQLCYDDRVRPLEVWLEHLRIAHPNFESEMARWPDGELVFIDLTLEPKDFAR